MKKTITVRAFFLVWLGDFVLEGVLEKVEDCRLVEVIDVFFVRVMFSEGADISFFFTFACAVRSCAKINFGKLFFRGRK